MSELVEEFELKALASDHPQWGEWLYEFKLFQRYCWTWQKQVTSLKKEIASLREVNRACMLKGARVALHYEREAERKDAHVGFTMATMQHKLNSATKRIAYLENQLLTLERRSVPSQLTSVLSSDLQSHHPK